MILEAFRRVFLLPSAVMTRRRAQKARHASRGTSSKKKVAVLATIAAAATITALSGDQTRRPLMTGSFTGAMWLSELLAGKISSASVIYF